MNPPSPPFLGFSIPHGVMSIEGLLTAGLMIASQGQCWAWIPVPISSFPLSPACLIYSSTSAGLGYNFQSTGLILSLFMWPVRELWSLQMPRALKARHQVLWRKAATPFHAPAYFPPSQLGSQHPYSISMPVLRSP